MSAKGSDGDENKAGTHVKRHAALDEVRARIDEVDAQLAPLLAERLSLATRVADIKADLNINIRDSSREQEVVDRVAAASDNIDVSNAIRKIYQVIFECSRHIQKKHSLRKVQEPLYFPQVTIVGMGMIGGVLARLIREYASETVIVGADLDQAALAEATSIGLIDRAETDLKKAASKAALIILAASPDANVQILEELAPLVRKNQLLIDVTSAKSSIVDAAERLKLAADFIGGHPMFGSEKSGLAAAADVNTDGSVFCLTPNTQSSEMSLRRLVRWVNSLGLKADVVEASVHDRIVARTSHTVQFMSVALGCQLSELAESCGEERLLSLCGPSVKQLSRLMSSPPELWAQIAGLNRVELIEALNSLADNLSGFADAIEKDDRTRLENAFAQARKIAEKLK